MKLSLPGLFALLPFAACSALYAQIPAFKALPAARSAALLPKITRQTAGLTHANRLAQQIAPLLKTAEQLPEKAAIPLIPLSIHRSVFTIQATETSKHKGSAFAITINGKVFGVTARHVLDDVGRSPFITVPGPQGEDVIFPVEPLKEGNSHGADLALFSIPRTAQELLIPLELADEIPAAYDILSSSGFAHGNFLSQPERVVLFASQYRILTKFVSFNMSPNGYCGSPLLHRGKVVGVHIGSMAANKIQSADWFAGTLRQFDAPVHDLSLAVPSFWLRKLASQAAGTYTAEQGVPLIFKNVEITRLPPDANINFIMQLRNGRVINTLPRYPFMDFTSLENFFEIEPGDVFRMEINQRNAAFAKNQLVWYEWDADSGRIINILKK